MAIVGAACRLPGGIETLDGLRQALEQERDLITTVPRERFPAELFVDASRPRGDKSYTAAGGFLSHDIAAFDAAYFGISPKEAAYIDPQHRLLLELTAEALDDAAIAPDSLAGSDTAVYIGISDASYASMQTRPYRRIGPYTMSGAALSIAANRISYSFDLHGPSMAVDTACSSSLVALDGACRNLWEGNSPVAICGGVNLLLSPVHYIGFSQAAMLSPSGRCSPFSAAADGFVRAEGGAVLVLKPLQDALAHGDRIHAVILGTAANSDGRTLGMTLPSAQAQENLLRRLYAEAGVSPDELVYLEAHGTGTPAGDPVEARAIGQALGMRRITGELPIGSVKSNLGHLEPASGMAGLCKALLVLKNRSIPATLHGRPAPADTDLARWGLTLATTARPVPETERPAVGVNSFGFGGTNAHAVLTSAPPPEAAAVAPPVPPEELPVLVTARTPQALSAAVQRMAERLKIADAAEFYDIAYTSYVRRGRHGHRAVVLARTAQSAAAEFTALAGVTLGTPTDAPERTEAYGRSPDDAAGAVCEAVPSGRVAFLFSGNGSPWPGMAAGLLSSAAFRQAVTAVDEELAPRLGWSVGEALSTPADRWRLEDTAFAQPLLFAVQLGLVAELRAAGIEPVALLGHSVGEVAAAHVGGALTVAQAAEVIVERSRAQARTAGRGRMAAVGLAPDRALEEIARYADDLEIAGVNSPQDVTLSGNAEALKDLGRRLAERGVFFRDLSLNYAFHSRAMDSERRALTAALSGLRPSDFTIPLYSTVTGFRAAGRDLTAAYWWRNVREPVRFAEAAERMVKDGADICLEIGPHPVLRPYVRRVAAERPDAGVVHVAALHRDGEGRDDLRRAHAALIAAGAMGDGTRWFPRPGRVVDLPAYPWQRERHWVGSPESWVPNNCTGRIDHPLLGERMPTPHPSWDAAVEPVLAPWVLDHRIGGSVVLPATAYAEMALAAGRSVLGEPVEAEHLDILHALVIPAADPSSVHIQTALNPADGTVTITSMDGGTTEPRPHARARVRALLWPRPGRLDLDALRRRCAHHVAAEQYYQDCAEVGLEYGPAFQLLTDLHHSDSEVVATYRCDAPGAPYVAHPALLDAALQAGVQLLARRLSQGYAHLPASIGAVRLWQTPPPTGAIHVVERTRTDSEVCWDIDLTDAEGAVVAQLTSCRLRRLTTTGRTPPTAHHTVLRAAPRPDMTSQPSSLPSSTQILDEAQETIGALRAAWPAQRHAALATLLKEYAARTMAASLARVLPDPTAPFSLGDLKPAGVPERYQRLAVQMTPLMRRYGLLSAVQDGTWRLTDRSDGRGADLLRQALAQQPAAVADIAVTTHLFARPEAGPEDAGPAAARIAGGDAHLRQQLYETSPAVRFHHRVAQALLSRIVAHWPADRALRVLEVGAGFGGTTAALLPLLPADRTYYRLTDTSPAALSVVRKRFAAHDFVDYRTYDLDLGPEQQDGTEHSFDLIVAGYALRSARDPGTTLRHLARLLAPGGRLLGLETHDAELVISLLDVDEDLGKETSGPWSPVRPMRSRRDWTDLLPACGYTEVVHTGDDRAPLHDQYSVFLATAPDGQEPPQPVLPSPGARTVFLLAGETPEAEPLARTTAELLRGDSRPALTGSAGATTKDWAALLSSAMTQVSGEPPQRLTIALLLGEAPEPSPNAQVDRTVERALIMRAAAAACAALPATVRTDFWLVTSPCGAVPAPGAITQPHDAAAWGLSRTLANETPELGWHRLSLQRGTDTNATACLLARELLDPSDEEEIVLTGQSRFVPRERPWQPARPATAGTAYRLRVRNPGLSYQVAWEEMTPLMPGPDEVVVAVRAAGLNYRDTVQAAGLLPSDVFEGTASEKGLGLECSGIVTACGPEVTAWQPGDRVFGFGHATLATHTVAKESYLLRTPSTLTDAEAATLPMAGSTVLHSLVHLARLQPGESVLVHGAAGGVGLAAVQFATDQGAVVITTAGTPLKRGFLRALGFPHVLDSRSLDFTHQVMEITQGRGVDIVLNSLAGEALTRGLEVLAPGGRFLELGKRDICENNPLPLRPFANDIAFFGVDISKVIDDGRRKQQLRTTIQQHLDAGALRPLPHTVFPASRIGEALQLLQHSRHIGKVVTTFDPLDEPPLVEPLPRPPRLDPNGTYLITGGTSGFGAATATWLAGLGARHLALVSRRGPEAPQAAALTDRLNGHAVRTTVHAADTTDAEGMRALIKQIDATGHPLRGLVHCAMHLDDAPIAELTSERLAAVLAPKMAGAALLDRLTRDRSCDLFLLYSSTSATVGQATQAPYAAGNLYLEALTRQRRQLGHTATTLRWGVIGEVGYVARNHLTRPLAALGIEPLRPQDAFEAAEALWADPTGVCGIARCNWARLGRVLPALRSPRFAALMPDRAHAGDTAPHDLSQQLSRLTTEEALAAITDRLRTLVAGALHMEPDALDPGRHLDAYGMDSLMAAEFLTSLQQLYNVDIPPLELLRTHGTLRDVAHSIHTRLGLAGTVPPHTSRPDPGGS
ncbi:SDR family NAD(P)-dependent oxidoreductase [Streptomyces sp. ISL-11]|uniref:SDR family NAD(P)-dependent oxidoreductase n=1 Tax=Streptomyces sp. ISL-11 TaxID=2819174 RepID=UPI0027E42C11|nr:SDR family NAD(P)-dependent oxidoreductase [Streptomyces sp. ISL-11]